MLPTSNGVSKFYLLVPKGIIYLVVSFVFTDIHSEDLSFYAKVIAWPKHFLPLNGISLKK